MLQTMYATKYRQMLLPYLRKLNILQGYYELIVHFECCKIYGFLSFRFELFTLWFLHLICWFAGMPHKDTTLPKYHVLIRKAFQNSERDWRVSLLVVSFPEIYSIKQLVYSISFDFIQIIFSTSQNIITRQFSAKPSFLHFQFFRGRFY